MPDFNQYIDFTIVDGANATVYDSNSTGNYTISGTVATTVNWSVVFSGTPVTGMTFLFRYEATVTLGGGTHLYILGAQVPDEFATKQFTATARYNGSAWVVRIMPDFEEDNIISAGKIAADAVTTTKIKDSAVTLAKLADQNNNTFLANNTGGAAAPIGLELGSNAAFGRVGSANASSISFAEGDILGRATGGNLDSTSITTMFTTDCVLSSGKLFVGTATNVPAEQTPKGDVTLAADGTFTLTANSVITANITADNVTPSRLSADARTELITARVTFETGELGDYKIKVPFKCEVVNIYAIVTKLIEATNNGTILLKDNAGTTMTGSTLTATAADAFGTAYNSAVTANNALAADDILSINTAKVTAGGAVLVSIEVERQD